jgi:hypothetical protein
LPSGHFLSFFLALKNCHEVLNAIGRSAFKASQFVVAVGEANLKNRRG